MADITKERPEQPAEEIQWDPDAWLNAGRSMLDDADRRLFALLIERQGIVEKWVAPAKLALGLPAYVPLRHNEVIASRANMGEVLGISRQFGAELFKLITGHSVTTQLVTNMEVASTPDATATPVLNPYRVDL